MTPATPWNERVVPNPSWAAGITGPGGSGAGTGGFAPLDLVIPITTGSAFADITASWVERTQPIEPDMVEVIVANPAMVERVI